MLPMWKKFSGPRIITLSMGAQAARCCLRRIPHSSSFGTARQLHHPQNTSSARQERERDKSVEPQKMRAKLKCVAHPTCQIMDDGDPPRFSSLNLCYENTLADCIKSKKLEYMILFHQLSRAVRAIWHSQWYPGYPRQPTWHVWSNQYLLQHRGSRYVLGGSISRVKQGSGNGLKHCWPLELRVGEFRTEWIRLRTW